MPTLGALCQDHLFEVLRDGGADALRKDLLEANGRKVSRNYVKRIADFVGSIAQAKEEVWGYEIPVPEKSVAAIV